jgi:hypothetical protein
MQCVWSYGSSSTVGKSPECGATVLSIQDTPPTGPQFGATNTMRRSKNQSGSKKKKLSNKYTGSQNILTQEVIRMKCLSNTREFILNYQRQRKNERDTTSVVTGSDVFCIYYVRNNLLCKAQKSGCKMCSSMRRCINLRKILYMISRALVRKWLHSAVRITRKSA